MNTRTRKNFLDIESMVTRKLVLTPTEQKAGDKGFLVTVLILIGVMALSVVYGKLM